MGAQEFESRLSIYTDGACSTNGTWESGAAIGVYINDRPLHHIGKYLGTGTNNTAELRAFIMALDYISRPNHFPKNISIMSDSAYIVNCLNNGWYKKWRTNGWKTSVNKPVANKEMWEELLMKYEHVSQFYNVAAVKVKGHSDDPFNNEVDRIAVYCKDKKENYDK